MAAGPRWFTLLVYGAQFFFGGWFLLHGLNFFVEIFPQPKGSSGLSHELIGALIHSGLFTIVKLIEIFTGLLLLANRFVPLAAVLAFPVSFSIAHLNYAANGDAFSVGVSVAVIALNALIAIGHLDKFLPMLVSDAGTPSLLGVRRFFGRQD